MGREEEGEVGSAFIVNGAKCQGGIFLLFFLPTAKLDGEFVWASSERLIETARARQLS